MKLLLAIAGSKPHSNEHSDSERTLAAARTEQPNRVNKPAAGGGGGGGGGEIISPRSTQKT